MNKYLSCKGDSVAKLHALAGTLETFRKREQVILKADALTGKLGK